MSKNKYSVVGCILIFIVTVLICTRFSYGTLWIDYIGKSSTVSFWLNMLTLAVYTAVFIIGIVFIKKAKTKNR